MIKKKRLPVILLIIAFILLGIYVYFSYYYYYEGRNSTQNDNAHNINILLKHYIEDNANSINSDMVLSNDKKNETNNTNSLDIDEILKNYSKKENLSLDSGCYYIEIRNAEIYRIIFAKWKYSGFVGFSPNPNNKCSIYEKEVKSALKEYDEYIRSKSKD